MLEKIQEFLLLNGKYLIGLLNINEKKIEYITITGGKALFIIIVGFILSRIIYIYTIKFFKKYKLKHKINKLEEFLEKDEDITKEEQEEKNINKKKLTDRIKIDIIAAKSFSIYVFLFFFKQSLIILNITEVSDSLDALLKYLPSLFVGVIIGFFGIRFANFIYDITYHTLSIAESNSKTKTSKIIATASRGLILFFTVTLVLNFTKLIDETTLNIILIGFISMVSLAGGIAFGLGGKDMAKDILDKFNNED